MGVCPDAPKSSEKSGGFFAKYWLIVYIQFMKNVKISLKTGEQKDFKNRWFYVKNYISFFDFVSFMMLGLLKGYFLLMVGMGVVAFIFGNNQIAFDFYLKYTEYLMWICLILPVISLLKSIKIYVVNGKIFFTKNNVLALWKKYKSIQKLQKSPNYFSFGFYGFFDPFWKRIVYLWFWLVPIVSALFIQIFWFFETMLIISLFVLLVYFSRQLVEKFHPLYAFGNLWEKIQKLTPKIEKNSKEIQKNFKEDSTNFHIFHEWFDSLSSTFSEIVTLVIELEKVEKRANKWNLFDSEKYINSLRSDIIEPLKSLKTFLEKQKEELLNSQEELKQIQVQRADPSLRSGWQRVRVRVWGVDPETSSGWQKDWGWQGQSGSQGLGELSSKRSESLLVELTENIAKLDEMIGKMG